MGGAQKCGSVGCRDNRKNELFVFQCETTRARAFSIDHTLLLSYEDLEKVSWLPGLLFRVVEVDRKAVAEMVFDVSNKEFPRTPVTGAVTKITQKSKFDKQREEEVIRNAHERGFLRAPTANNIWDSIGEKCDLGDINYLNMSGICLHTVQTIDLCSRLRICVLHSNYISSFDSLAHCRELAYLDLHNNQVTFPLPFESVEHL